jgi:YggT family protein
MDAAIASGLAAVISFLLSFVQILVFASIIISWVGGDPSNPVVHMIRRATEPIYAPIRRFTSRIPGPFDWAPLVVIAIIIFIQKSVVAWLNSYARSGGVN